MTLAVTRARRAGTLRAGTASSKKPPNSSSKFHDQIDLGTLYAKRPSSEPSKTPAYQIFEDRKLESPSSNWQTASGSGSGKGKEIEKKQRPSWDPLARYYSEANSFPDYGSPGETMSSLRKLNAIPAGGLNTMKSARAPIDSQMVIPEGQPPKRQKYDAAGSSTSIYSRFFVPKLASADDEANEISIVPSQEDPHDVVSTSSAGRPKTAVVGVSEYRHAQHSKTKSGNQRVRKSRSLSGHQRLEAVHRNSVEYDTTLIDANKAKTMHSPDVLGNENSPPLANVRSDVSRTSTKRSRLERSRVEHPVDATTSPRFKRAKFQQSPESVESEDELVKDHVPSRKTNFSVVLSPIRQRPSRGDIQPTNFQSKPPNPLPSPSSTQRKRQPQHHSISDLSVKKAVSGKYFYPEDDEHSVSLVLRQANDGSSRLLPSSSGKAPGELAWMSVDLDAITVVEHSSNSSPLIHLVRPRRSGSEPHLWLEADSQKDAAHFISILPSSKVQRISLDELNVKWDKSMNTAKQYSAMNHRKSSFTPESHSIQSQSGEMGQIQPISESIDKVIPRGERLVEKMQHQVTREGSRLVRADRFDDAELSRAPSTRRTRRSSPVYVPREESPNGWTKRNQNWRDRWHKSLIFPATGRNRATVDDHDITRLDEGEFLNDNLITFYVRYLQFKLESEKPELLNKVHFFSTFFFEKLRSTKGRINYDGVKAWTAKFDVFSYDYLVVPVNEHAHWYLAIICNTPNTVSGVRPIEEASEAVHNSSPKLATIERDMSDVFIQDLDSTERLTKESDTLEAMQSPSSSKTLPNLSPASKRQRATIPSASTHVDTRLPKIVTLDSLGSAHPATCRALKEYLIAEARDKKDIDLALLPTGMTAKRIPEQDNFCDCGVYILGYMEEFLKDPDETVRKLLQKEPTGWDIRPSRLRNEVRDLLFKLQQEQQERLEKEREEKRLSSAKKKAAAKAKAQQHPDSSPSQGHGREASKTTQALRVGDVTQVEPADLESTGTERPEMNDEPQEEDARQSGLPASDDDNAIRLVKHPREGSSTSASTSSNHFHTAPSSPSRTPSRDAPKKTRPKEQTTKPERTSRTTGKSSLVQILPSSSTDVEIHITPSTPKMRKKTPTESADADVIALSPNRLTRQSSKQLGSSPSLVQPLRSSSTSPRKSQARYDGIDRSVDLT